MLNSRIKAQRPSRIGEGGDCVYCNGVGRIRMKIAGGDRGRSNRAKQTKVCAYCRGTGKATKGYLTK